MRKLQLKNSLFDVTADTWKEKLQSRPTSYECRSPDGRTPYTGDITYDTDEEGKEYAIIGFTLFTNVFAEIEDGTYGEMQGIRVYL